MAKWYNFFFTNQFVNTIIQPNWLCKIKFIEKKIEPKQNNPIISIMCTSIQLETNHKKKPIENLLFWKYAKKINIFYVNSIWTNSVCFVLFPLLSLLYPKTWFKKTLNMRVFVCEMCVKIIVLFFFKQKKKKLIEHLC